MIMCSILNVPPGGLSGKESTCNERNVQDTWVQSLGWEDPLEKEGVSCLENSMDRGAWQDTVHGVTKTTNTH